MTWTDTDRFAVIADVHGNVWALQRVLEEITGRGIETIVNLGDCAYGPLRPAASMDLLIQHCTVSIAGNQDRILHSPPDSGEPSATFQYVNDQLVPRHLEWLQALPATYQTDDVFCCHGTPESDTAYLLETVTQHGVKVRGVEALGEKLRAYQQSLILCAHTHVPRAVWIRTGQLIVNPGSVGLPAYTDTDPYPHSMEAGSPHARFAILSRRESGWMVSHVAVPYDWDHAARVAGQNGRADWATWLRYGRPEARDPILQRNRMWHRG